MINKTREVSVVIPTLGGSPLKKTISCLNNSTIVPREILVCIPKEFSYKVRKLDFKNIKIVETERKGQVFQRAEGFKKALSDIVIQIDDDVLVNEDCIEELVCSLEVNGENAVTGPAIYEYITGEPIYKKINKNKFLQKIYYWLLNGKQGYRPGNVDKAGINTGIDYTTVSGKECSVQWLAGGCIAHHKKKLILEDFYPYSGKAYSEDLIHSYLLESKGCRLIVNTKAKCNIEILRSEKIPPLEYLDIFKSDYRARAYYVKLTGRSIFRMNFYYIAWCFDYISKYICRRVRFN